MNKTVTIYSTPTCHFCQMSKEFFKANGVEYTEKNVAADIRFEERPVGDRPFSPEGAGMAAGVKGRKIKTWNKISALQQCIEILGMGKSINPAESGGLSITIHPYAARAARG